MEKNVKVTATSQRLMCIDALRGFDMLWIIGGAEVLITFWKASGLPGNMEVNFDHTWGQFHFYDIIMPLFLFIVGAVMPMSFTARLNKGASKKSLYKHILRRVAILYFLGLIASGHLLTFDTAKMHLWTDTLHAIAIGYLVSSVLLLETNLKWQITVTSSLLVLYWLVMTFIPIPGVGAGYFEPTVNLAIFVDNAVLGHWQEGAGWTYILSNMTFICSVMLGVFAGKILQSGLKPVHKAELMTAIGFGCILAGKVWGIWFPVIHHLWTSTLVIYAGGLSFLLLTLFYLVIDVWGFRKWSFFFVVIGMNAIGVYVATHLFEFTKIGNVFVGGLLPWLGNWAPFVEASAALSVIWLILYWMYKTRTFIKI